jgi:hypothetical protein
MARGGGSGVLQVVCVQRPNTLAAADHGQLVIADNQTIKHCRIRSDESMHCVVIELRSPMSTSTVLEA